MKGLLQIPEEAMEDQTIIELYFARSEDAIGETDRKYGAFCRRVALLVR